MRLLLFITAIATTLTFNTTVRGHEFWIEPSTFQPDPGSIVRVELRVGERFLGEPVLRDPALVEKFVTVGPGDEQPVAGRSGKRTHFARVETLGLHWISYRSRRSFNQLDAKTFEAYLRTEGLEYILPLRAELGESEHPGREVYSRCAKSLIWVGNAGADGYDRLLGFPLELVPQQNPYGLKGGDELAVQLLYDGEPLRDATLVAVHQAAPKEMTSARTDARGQASFRLGSTGAWMITAIHMVRAPAGVDADWESFWASFTFEIPDEKVAKK